MDIDGFWAVVERSAAETGTRQARLEWLENHLSGLPAEEIVDYYVWFTLCRNRACTWDLYAVCMAITGGGSSNTFEFFADWLISLGRDDFEKVVGCPDRVLELPAVQRLHELSRTYRHERTTGDGRIRLRRVTLTRRSRWPDEFYPEFELFSYVSGRAYKRATGLDVSVLKDAVEARGVKSSFPFLTPHAQPDGEEWDFDDKAELIRRLPRLANHYGITADPVEEPARPRRRTWWPWYLPRSGDRIWSFTRGADGTIHARSRRYLSEADRLFMGLDWP
ncbi:DUF4240 domain-containing protein [Nonomuraea rubra]